MYYTYEYASKTLTLYYDESYTLHGEIVTEHGDIFPTELSGIVSNLMTATNETARGKISILKKHYYPTVNQVTVDGKLVGFSVRMNSRGLGGWGDDQHMGYELSKDKSQQCIAIGSRDGMLNGKPVGEGTYQWALDVFNNDKLAKTIADSDVQVDRDEDTNPVDIKNPEAQKWHFNGKVKVNYSCGYWEPNGGAETDTRIEKAFEQLIKAIQCAQQNDFENAYKALGKGLHPFQDVFAHTDAFVDYCKSSDEVYFFSHIPTESLSKLFSEVRTGGADNPRHKDEKGGSFESCISGEIDFNQRYSDAKTATYIYLYIFNLCLGKKKILVLRCGLNQE